MSFFHTVMEPAEGHALQMKMPVPTPTPTHPGVTIQGVWPGRGSAAPLLPSPLGGQATPLVWVVSPGPACGRCPAPRRSSGHGGAAGRRPAWRNVYPVASLQT